ncbi:MAG: U2 snRNP complex subunit [Phylliscum demangeonii]|nr:MAG: U2 snRNP complex subunit [Phylliscum demangeonii]
MRLTAELIGSSLSFLNPIKERELDLRGHKIPAIENLGVATNNDAIDLTDNDIAVLTNFPLMPRMRSLLLARNRVAAIHPGVTSALPNLTTLVLTANHLAELADLDTLAGFGRLTHLVLMENPVTRKEHYRSWVIWRCPSVRFLDFHKVKDVERGVARELFGASTLEPSPLASKIMAIKSRSFDLPASATITTSGATAVNGSAQQAAAAAAAPSDKRYRILLTPPERKRVEDLIRNAKSLQEIARLEKELREGRVPGGIGAGGGGST